MLSSILLFATPIVPEKCERAAIEQRVERAVAAAKSAAPAARRRDPLHMEVLDANAQPPVFVMRGGPHGPGKLVFLHGMCGHGLGYAQSFQFSAAKYGLLIAPQGDVSCGGAWSKWSQDTDALNARIEAAFKQLGQPEPLEDVVVLGYSQGGSRAEALARKWPRRYTRVVLMGGPSTPSARGLTSLRSAVTMAGSRDRQDLMRAGAKALLAAGVPATYKVIPEATHGAMGPTPETTMGEALDWLFTHSR